MKFAILSRCNVTRNDVMMTSLDVSIVIDVLGNISQYEGHWSCGSKVIMHQSFSYKC